MTQPPGWTAMLLLVVATALVLSPFFFVIERLALFNTVPRDDYAPYLLWLTGHLAGPFPVQSPYGYRLLSVAPAMPFFSFLPVVLPTNLPASVTPDQARATNALTALSYLSLVAACLGIWRLALQRRREPLAALTAAVLLFVCAWYTEIVALDCVTLAAIVLGLWLLPHRGAFAAFLLASIAINEKIIIVFAIWLTLRCLCDRTDRRRLTVQWAGTLIAALLYLAAVKFIELPGNAYQLTPASFLDTFRQNVVTSLTLRGLILNGLPTLFLLGLATLSRHPRATRTLADILTVPALVLVAMTLTEMLQIGRIVMHAAPLLVIPAADRICRRRSGGAAP